MDPQVRFCSCIAVPLVQNTLTQRITGISPVGNCILFIVALQRKQRHEKRDKEERRERTDENGEVHGCELPSRKATKAAHGEWLTSQG